VAAGATLVIVAALQVRPAPAPDIPVVASLDPLRYSGTWFELARLPGGELRRCAADVTATYAPRPGGRFVVVDRCLRHDGQLDVAKGEVRARRGDRTGARLEVNFVPQWLHRLRFGWGGHNVVAVDPDYRVAVVSDSERHELRVLSRVPELEPDRLLPLMATLRAKGFAVDRLVRTPQGAAGIVPTRAVNVTT
jgi:apolipoprotein D and lipocalin family protein